MVSVQCLKPVRLSGFDADFARRASSAPLRKLSRHVFRSEIVIPARCFHSHRRTARSCANSIAISWTIPPTPTFCRFRRTNGGDIAICAPVAVQNARRFNEPPARELLRLIVHGTLHLLGYKDEPQRAQKKMWKKQERPGGGAVESLIGHGLVLRRRKHLEFDVKLLVLMREYGKVAVVSRGGQKLNSKLKALHEPFTSADFQLYATHDGHNGRLGGGRLLNSNIGLRAQHRRIYIGQPLRGSGGDVAAVSRSVFRCL